MKKNTGGGILLTGAARRSIARLATGVIPFVVLVLAGGSTPSYADGWLNSSRAPNEIATTPGVGVGVGGITNTRHNLTMTYLGASKGIMDTRRNDYVEICVYCHTPHGANKTVAAPLWNRTTANRQYDLYNKPTTLGRPITTPGPNSLTCLSCHDGFTAIDSVINMPTKRTGAYAGFSEGQETAVTFGFLSTWDGGPQGSHAAFVRQGSGAQSSECYACHNPTDPSGGIPDFGIFVIGQNYIKVDPVNGDTLTVTASGSTQGGRLADDHPIGVKYPQQFGPNVDYQEPTVKKGRIAFFDRNGNNHADPNEVRLYDTGDGYEVECASCHDPHGVKVSESSNKVIPSFLRVGRLASDVTNGDLLAGTDISGNAESELCLTCHVK